jgi:threonine/homoserine/homoserine lactone efflux protein
LSTGFDDATVSSLLVSLAAGVVFGLALAAPPGPMNALIAEESVLRGWRAGFRAGLGAATADFVFFLLALAGVVTFVQRLPVLRAVMVGVGGCIMCYYAYGAARSVGSTFRDAADPGETEPSATADGSAAAATGREGDGDGGGDEHEGGSESAGFRKAFVLALTNPYQIVFWLAVGVGLLEPGRVDVLRRLPAVGADLAGTLVVRTGSPALLAGLFCGILVWITGFPAALVSAERRVDRFAPAVAALSALVLAGFGVAFLLDAVRSLA